MKNEKEIVKADEINFHGKTFLTAEIDGEVRVSMKPVCDAIGLDWGGQHKKLLRDKIKFSYRLMSTTGKDGKTYKMFSIPLKKLEAWIFTINPNKVKPEIKHFVILMQDEIFDVIFQYYHKGKAENPRFRNKIKKIDRIEAHKLFKTFTRFNINFGLNRSAASIKAMNDLLEEYDYDLAAAQGMSREEAESFFINQYGPASKPDPDSKASHFDFEDQVFCDWLKVRFDKEHYWWYVSNCCIRDIYENYIEFCEGEDKGYKTYQGWARAMRAIFQEHIKRVRKTGESRRYYKFPDLATCRRQLEKYTGQQFWPLTTTV